MFAVIGNDQASYKGPAPQVPMDFAIKLGWKSIMKTIVRLSSLFRNLPGLTDNVVPLFDRWRPLEARPPQ